MSGAEKLRECHVDVFKRVLQALSSRIPFGVDIDEATVEDLMTETELITDEAMAKLKPVLLPELTTRTNRATIPLEIPSDIDEYEARVA